MVCRPLLDSTVYWFVPASRTCATWSALGWRSRSRLARPLGGAAVCPAPTRPPH